MSVSGSAEGLAAPTDNQKTAELTLENKNHKLPVYQGTLGPDVIDINALYRDTGCFTYDPGFTSTASCESKLTFIDGEEEKFTAFKLADAALATSGTVTLELALAGTPMVVGYHTEFIVAMFRWMLRAHSIVLPNLILGENFFPEFIQEECTPDALSNALLPLLDKSSPERKAQIKALKGIGEKMRLVQGTPSQKAAGIILNLAQRNLTS